jgi:8-oxo-dGTP pyrophosphatase MutT (NUDIX family)
MPGYWCPPSRRIEPDESQEQAVVREVAEELGLVARPIAKVWECPTDDGDLTLHWWIADADANEVRPDPGEVAEVRWVTPDEFLKFAPHFARRPRVLPQRPAVAGLGSAAKHLAPTRQRGGSAQPRPSEAEELTHGDVNVSRLRSRAA